jgi:Chalcone isomerase-like
VGARFWVNGVARAPINDPEFSRLFFGIWLSSATSEPKLRAALLANAPP